MHNTRSESSVWMRSRITHHVSDTAHVSRCASPMHFALCTRSRLAQEHHEVGGWHLDAVIGEQCGDLAAVLGLVVDDLKQGVPGDALVGLAVALVGVADGAAQVV